MQYILPILLFCFIVFLFCLYILSRDDFVLFRKTVSQDQIFNTAFTISLFGLFSSRLTYVLFHFNHNFLNPLAFLLFTYYPGLSLSGGVIGGVFCLLFVLRSRKFPKGHIADMVTLSFFSSLQFGFFLPLILELFTKKLFHLQNIIVPVLSFISFLFFITYFLPKQKKGDIHDGSFTLLFLSVFALLEFISKYFSKTNITQFLTDKENVILLCIFIIPLVLLFRQEKLILRFFNGHK